MAEIVLTGCTPTPLSAYLKGLGVLRLLSRRQPDIKAVWRGEAMVLVDSSDCDVTESFILNDYHPTPILAPWSGDSGFYKKNNKDALNAIRSGNAVRLTEYRESLVVVERALDGMDRDSSPEGANKTALLTRVRSTLPDIALEWFDAAILLTGDSYKAPPLLGTGGNDGRLDFTNNFMQRIMEVMDPETGIATVRSSHWLRMALFSDPAPGLVKKVIGQFAPGQVGGPNATTGLEAKSSINPWDFILMLEGALFFAAAAVRRNAEEREGVLSYPFTARAVGAGSGNLGQADTASARGELWMPLWRQPATYLEIRALLSEGRVALGKRPAKDALDFIRAVHRLGGYRGIDRFQRYGLLKRSGKAYLATPLERVQVTSNPETDWTDELEHQDWLVQLQRFSQSNKAANRFVSLRHRLENTLFTLARSRATPAEVQSLLSLLGEIQTALAVGAQARKAVRPVPRLSERWVRAADDGTSAFRIARALAGLSGSKDQPLPLRAQLFPVHPRRNNWIDVACSAKGMQTDPACRVRLHTGLSGPLIKTLNECLTRRLWLADRLNMPDKPLQSPAGIDLDDLNAFLRDQRMDRQIAALLPGLALCQIPLDTEHAAGTGTVPAAFALLKLCLTPDTTLQYLERLGEDEHLPVPTGLLAQLGVGNSGKAVRAAWRRLRFSGLAPLFMPNALPELIGIDPRRAAAALLIPLRLGTSGALVRSVLRNAEITDDAA